MANGLTKRPFRLVVEGSDDMYVAINILLRDGYDWNSADVQVIDAQGISKLLSQASATVKSYQRSAFIIDADESIGSRWQALADRLASANIHLPPEPVLGGTIVQGMQAHWRVGAWVMPDNQSHGTLEEFLQSLIPEDDLLWPFACTATEQARNHGASYDDLSKLKCCLHAWLAWQETPGVAFGTAVNAKYFDTNTREARHFAAWFRQVFEAPDDPITSPEHPSDTA